MYNYLLEVSNGPESPCDFLVTGAMDSDAAANAATNVAVKSHRIVTVYAGSDGTLLAHCLPTGDVYYVR